MDSQMETLLSKLKSETDPFVKAKLIKTLNKDYEMKQIDLAKKLSMKPSYLCHFLRLNRLPEIVIDGYYNNDISLSHLFVISRLKEIEQIATVYEKVLAKNLTVLQTEELVREIRHGIKSKGETLSDEEKAKFLGQFTDGTSAKIIQTRIKSKLIIEIRGSLEKTTKMLRSILQQIKL